MAIQGVGRFVVKGVHGYVQYTGVAAVAMSNDNTRLMGASVRNEFGVSEHRDGESQVFAVTADDPIHRLSIRFIPTARSGGNNNLSDSKLNCVLPDRLAEITLGGFGVNNIDGTWYYQGGSIDYSPDSPVEMSMELARYGTDPNSNAFSGAPAPFNT